MSSSLEVVLSPLKSLCVVFELLVFLPVVIR